MAPRLAPIEEVARRAGVSLRGVPAANARFVVVEPGSFAGRTWSVGDVLLCRGPGSLEHLYPEPVQPRTES